jgi:hypothetical protein
MRGHDVCVMRVQYSGEVVTNNKYEYLRIVVIYSIIAISTVVVYL